MKPGGLTDGEGTGGHPPVGRPFRFPSKRLDTPGRSGRQGCRWRAEVRCGGEEGVKLRGCSRGRVGEAAARRPWLGSDGAGSGERSPGEATAGGVANKSLRQPDNPLTATSLLPLAPGKGSTGRSVALPGMMMSHSCIAAGNPGSGFSLKVGGRRSCPGQSPACCQHGKELMVYWSRHFHIPQG